MKSDATKQTAHTMATVRNEARTPMADAAASGTPVRMAAAEIISVWLRMATNEPIIRVMIIAVVLAGVVLLVGGGDGAGLSGGRRGIA